MSTGDGPGREFSDGRAAMAILCLTVAAIAFVIWQIL